MRIDIFHYNRNFNGNEFITSGLNMQGPLILAGNPTQPLEAAPKQYVDSVAQNLNAANITSGVLSAAMLPGFTGDLLSSAGSNILTLKNSGVTAGTYTKVTIDSKGIITAGSNIIESDIPSGLNWSKIKASSLPTTLSGYGITNAVSVNGATLTGFLSLTQPAIASGHAVTKQYVDTLVSNSGISVGDIILKPYSTTPSGFLKCNGALVDKTTYADLYAVIGDRFGFDIMPGSGQPWRQQYHINTTQSDDITGWATSTSLPAAFGDSQAIVTKNRVYLLGGRNSNGSSSTVYTAPINSDGTLGTWTTSTPLPVPLEDSQVIVTKNRIYLLGGYSLNTSATVYTAPINSDGTLGAWTTGPSLPAALGDSQAIVTKNRVYLLGGRNSGNANSVIDTVYTAPINSDGTLGAWTTGNPLPIPIGFSQAIVTKNRVYLLGGYNSNGLLSTVYTAPINSDGTLGNWTINIPLPIATMSNRAIVTKNRVYLLGGYNTNNFSSTISTIYTAPINGDGTLGTWATGGSLPGEIASSQAIVTKNRIYLLGGFSSNNTTPTSTVYTAPLSGGLNDYSPYYDGSIEPFNDPNLFALPVLTTSDPFGSYSYIKY